jgi:hypothetical protein
MFASPGRPGPSLLTASHLRRRACKPCSQSCDNVINPPTIQSFQNVNPAAITSVFENVNHTIMRPVFPKRHQAITYKQK